MRFATLTFLGALTARWTETAHSAYIQRLFGQRADWSHDGEKILLLEKTYSDAFQIDMITRVIAPVTQHKRRRFAFRIADLRPSPVVDDDGRYMAFQIPKVEQFAGVGIGLYVMDLKAAGV